MSFMFVVEQKGGGMADNRRVFRVVLVGLMAAAAMAMSGCDGEKGGGEVRAKAEDGLAGASFGDGSGKQESGKQERPEVWICPPMRKKGNGTLWQKDAEWEIAKRGVKVFKFYGSYFRDASDEVVERTVEVLKENDIAIAMEFGPIRGEPWRLKDMSDRVARYGGKIEYIDLDNGLGVLLDGGKFGNTAVIRDMDRPATPQEAAEEIVGWLKEAQQLLPGTKFGLIECVWRYPIGEYPGSIPEKTFKNNLPPHEHDLREVLDVFLAEAKKQGVRLDYFHGEHGRLQLPQIAEGRDVDVWGKLKTLEEYVHSKGLEFGILYADESTAWWWPDKITENQEQVTVDNMYASVVQHIANGGKPDHVVVQNWGKYPTKLVPEDEEYTFMQLVKKVLRMLRE